jgi:hypothetical protein
LLDANQPSSGIMSQSYQFDENDHALLKAATALLEKVATVKNLRPTELVSVAKIQHVFAMLPKVVSGVDVSISVSSPQRYFGEIETTSHWWQVSVKGASLSISSGGLFYRTYTGAEFFTTMKWAAVPEQATQSDDYRGSLRKIPDVRSFPDGVASIDLSSEGFTVEIADDSNPVSQ